MSFRYNILLLVIFFGFSCFGQSDQMLMEQVEGKIYIKKSYDSDGRLEGSQKIEIGKITEIQTGFQINIKVFDYDQAGKLIDSFTTTYSCLPNQSEIFLNILPLTGYSSNKKIFIEAENEMDLYPRIWTTGTKLNDVIMKMNILGGVVGFLSSESTVSIVNRIIKKKSEKNGNFLITGNIVAKFYSFGINIKTLKIKLTEWVHPIKGLISQRFTFEDGSYFKIQLNQ